MASAVFNAFEIARPAFLLGLYAILIGLGVQAAVARYVRFPRSIGLTAGIGLSATAVIIFFSYHFADDATTPIWPLAAVAALAIAARFVFVLKKCSWNTSFLWRWLRSSSSRSITPIDIMAAVAVALVMYPVTKFGLTYWTNGTADFPNYASSAKIWMTSAAAFAEKHPDAFGDLQLHRASFEKPMVTALLVAMSQLSDTPPYQLLTPAFLFYLFILATSLLVLCSRLFGLGLFTTTITVLTPALSLVPMSRVYDAQLGQAAAVSLLACTFAIVGTAVFKRSAWGIFAFALVTAVVSVAALGSNFTLVIGSGIALAALVVWAALHRAHYFTRLTKAAAVCALLIGAICLPLLSWFKVSFAAQTTGVPGFNIPLASPLAIVGQQISLASVSEQSQTLLSWSVLLVIVSAVLWIRAAYVRRASMLDFFVLAAATANILIIGLKLGWSNYSVHKYLAVVIAVLMPLVLSYATSKLRGRARIAAIFTFVPLLISSLWISLQHGSSVQIVMSPDLVSLQNHPKLAEQDFVNIDLKNLHEDSFAALLSPSRSATILRSTYARPTPPNTGLFLIRSDKADADIYSNTVKLNDTYSLASIDLSLTDTKIEFNSKHPASRRFLFGNWHPLEEWGTWSGRKNNYVVFDLPPELQSRDFNMTVTGYAFSHVTTPQEIEVLVNDSPLGVQTYQNEGARTFTVSVPRQLTEASNGRVTVNFKSKRLMSPSEFGYADKRFLTFGLISLQVGP
ncbi:hypothetical protein [Hyphomicrobium sp. LHD-15]|uniref:hypothetical protein n=1 Tax=Hyphomicrobium sp. LHD-15 TaxID=3072142 RepID=UPI00280F2120|nr:hypothetical protein [Hyphomicrobium sp. LHD-15]MDQ8699880.1 hypothetical protein [Hyphomicrobium sp. LHD-15]